MQTTKCRRETGHKHVLPEAGQCQLGASFIYHFNKEMTTLQMKCLTFTIRFQLQYLKIAIRYICNILQLQCLTIALLAIPLQLQCSTIAMLYNCTTWHLQYFAVAMFNNCLTCNTFTITMFYFFQCFTIAILFNCNTFQLQYFTIAILYNCNTTH